MMSYSSPRKIVMIGPGGSGKTLLAEMLSEKLQRPYISEQFRMAKTYLNRLDIPEEHRARIEQGVGVAFQVNAEIGAGSDGFVSDRGIYDFMIYSNLRGLTWPKEFHDEFPDGIKINGNREIKITDPQKTADEWFKHIGGYDFVVYVPPFSDDPPEADGFRYTDPEFIKRERQAFATLVRATEENDPVHPLGWSIHRLKKRHWEDRLEEVVHAMFSPVYRRMKNIHRHDSIMRGVEAARKEGAKK